MADISVPAAEPTHAQGTASSRTRSTLPGSVFFPLHVVVIYALAFWFAPRFAGFLHGWLLPRIQAAPSESSFEFLGNHLIWWCAVPAVFTALSSLKWRQRAAWFAWVVPTALLAYKLVTYAAPTSVLASSATSGALHHYFGTGFVLPEFHTFSDLFTTVAASADAPRFLDQTTYTAPFYVGIAYSATSVLCSKTKLLDALKGMLAAARRG